MQPSAEEKRNMSNEALSSVEILIVMGMSDNIAESHSHTIAESRCVSRVHVVRDTPGYPHPKVAYHCVPRCLQKSNTLRTLYKLAVVLILSLHPRISLIYGVHMYPHGIFAKIASMISGKPLVLFLVAGKAEIHYWGRLVSKFVHWILTSTDLIAVTGFQTKRYLHRLGIRRPIVSLFSLTSTRGFSRTQEQKRWDILAMTRLTRVKRIDIFLRVAAALRDVMPIQAAIAGDGPELASLKEMVTELDLQDSVRFLGWIRREDVNMILNQSKILLLTSDSEGAPTTMLESMKAGVCFIAPEVGDIPSIIETGKNGFLVKNNEDISEYVSIIRQVLQDPTLLEHVTNEAIASVEMLTLTRRTAFWEKLLCLG